MSTTDAFRVGDLVACPVAVHGPHRVVGIDGPNLLLVGDENSEGSALVLADTLTLIERARVDGVHFDVTDGTWRQVTEQEWSNDTEHDSIRSGSMTRPEFYLRHDPVPPLPIEAFALIRARWNAVGGGGPVETYVYAAALGRWTNVNTGVQHTPKELLEGIESWEAVAR